jgi:hypothetical protein
MEKPSLDRESVFISQACHLEKGIQFFAEFLADKVSNPKAGRRYYAVTLTIDPATQRPRNDGIWQLTENRSYSGRKDRLRELEYQLCDYFLKTQAWEILSRQAPNPNFAVNQLGQIVDPPTRVTRRF